MRYFSSPRFLASILTVLSVAAAFVSPSALAQPSGAQGSDFLYRVVPNDTLITLAAKYTSSEQNWHELQSLNHVADPKALPIGLVLRIPFQMIPQLPGDAVVTHVAGDAWLDQRRLQIGDSIAEGGSIRTSSNGFLTLRLSDNSTITIPADASVAVQRLRVFKNVPLTDTIISVDNGSLESHVAPDNTGVGRFEVRTPVSITGVRGTRLRVHASDDGALSEVIEGTAQLNTQNNNATRLTQNQGAAVSDSGQLLGVRTLLPAPQLPAIAANDYSGQLVFPAVSGADHYLVRIATDPEGQHLLSSHQTPKPMANFGRQSTESYLLVRAIDETGLGGHDAVTTIPAGRVLISSDGTPVRSGFGDAIQLSQH